MARQVDVNAKGNSGDTAGPVKTPAPTKRVVPSAPDQVSFVRKPSPNGYAMNGPQPSSVGPGAAMCSPLAQNLRGTVQDAALDAVIASGSAAKRGVNLTGDADDENIKGQTGSQLRTYSADQKVPTTHGMRSRNNEGGTVPSTLGASNGAPVRKPS